MDHNIKLLILPPHSSHFTQPLDIGVFSPLKAYMSAELDKVIRTDIARLKKAEWVAAYSRARPSAFTLGNINGSWAGAGLNPFQPRKVIRRVQPKSPTPPSTPLPPCNLFENTLLLSSPSDMLNMHNANQALQATLATNSALKTPEKEYIVRLGRKAEAWKARMTMLDKEKTEARAVLAARRTIENGRRKSLQGRHLISTEEIYEDVMAAEKVTAERKTKRAKSTTAKSAGTLENQEKEEKRIEIFDCITVERYKQ